MDPLEASRVEIDRIDRELIRCLAERVEVVKRVAAFKRDHPDVPLRNDDRERAISGVWVDEARKRGMSTFFLGQILREILNYSRRDQERVLVRNESPYEEARAVRVGYQGAPGAYSDLAIEKLFESRPTPVRERAGFHSFRAVLDALEANEIDYALLPIENTVAGSINEVYQLLADRNVHVVDEEYWEVKHVVAGLPGAELDDLEVIRSHPVALQQCVRFLEGLVGCTAESHFDTAGSAQSVLHQADPRIGAICSEEAALRVGLVVLQRDIADQPHNTTRFLLIAREAEKIDPRLAARTSLLFTADHRRGALAGCLHDFDQQGINLCKLESRPLPELPWEYLFYIDVEGNVDDPRMERALESLREHANQLRVLGCYPNRSAKEKVVSPWENGDVPAAPSVPAEPSTGEARKPSSTVVRVGDVEIGADTFTLILGPCAVESRSQMIESAAMAREAGAHLLRGGVFKPRTSPRSFQGLGWEGLDLLVEAGRAYSLPVVTEVLRAEDVQRVAQQADVLQVGARSMQNFALLRELGRIHRPVLLKRGMSATIDELLSAADYILSGGNQQVIFCERGIRTFETSTRATLDVSAIPVLKSRSPLPVIVDPSHAAGKRELVVPLACAAAAGGADGLIIELHPDPPQALCDRDQALTRDELSELGRRLGAIATAMGKRMV